MYGETLSHIVHPQFNIKNVLTFFISTLQDCSVGQFPFFLQKATHHKDKCLFEKQYKGMALAQKKKKLFA